MGDFEFRNTLGKEDVEVHLVNLETRDVQVAALWVWLSLRWGQWPCTETSLKASPPASHDCPPG